MNEKRKVMFSADALPEMLMNDAGGCIECGAIADTVEPDARAYRCEACGAYAVYGAEELLLMGRFEA